MPKNCDFCGNELISYYDKNNCKQVEVEGQILYACPTKCAIRLDKEDGIKKLLALRQGANIEKKNENIKKKIYQDMILTTSDYIQGHDIIQYKGIVGAKLLKVLMFLGMPLEI